jgi:maltooligosyltrehalose trehalohydrolase
MTASDSPRAGQVSTTGVSSVWAPDAGVVELVIGDERRPMERGDNGWWTAEAQLPAGVDYAFSLDGGQPLPDPRSPWQPAGVHGPSRTIDHSAFPWTDGDWRGGPPLSAALIYELHVGTFTPEGTFEAVVAKLPHLLELGVTHVELMPVAEFPGRRGWGYDGVDLFAPHAAYGGPDALKRLVDACHRAGLAVLLDVVYNHLGPDGNYLGSFGPYFTDRYATPWGQAVNFDGPHSDQVRDFVCDNACMWLTDYHLDGLRLDAVHAIFDTSATHVLEELGARVHALEAHLGRRLVVVAESDLNDPRLVQPVEVGGYGLDAAWSDDFHHALHAVLTGERSGYYEDFGSLADLARALQSAYVYDGRYSPHRRRRHGRPPDGVPARRFLGYLQNHDQVGNRAQGERSAALMGLRRLKIGAALVLTSPFVPLLFAGEEWGASTPFLYFTDHQDPDLGRAVSAGRRREFAAFGWDPEAVPDPQDPRSFERSRLEWSELARPPHAELLDWHRRLVALRPHLSGPARVRFDEAAGWLALGRGTVIVAANLAKEPRHVPLVEGTGEVLLTSDGGARLGDGLTLPSESVAVVTHYPSAGRQHEG